MKTLLWALGGVFIGLPTLGWVILFLGMVFSPAPSKPTITNGEFPFKLVYDINGEQKVIEDKVICEYEGIGWNEGVCKKFRKWKNYLASGKDTSIVLFSKANSSFHIYYYVGYAEYYMGAGNGNESDSPAFYNNGDGKRMSTEELLKYGIKIISWDYTQPIVNEFK